ncbi:MAG: flippase-like domain-containing protein [Candidatus Cloacimonetes bacterium]|nr:flippase-like domain-containing protein [Candidatus Cloacimonadota bacterium]
MKFLTRNKKKVATILKIIITALVLYFISSRIDFVILMKNFSKISLFSIVIIVFTTLIKLAIQYSNWRDYLKLNPRNESPHIEIIKSFFIGMSLHFLLPAGVGQFGKIYFINNKKSATVFSVGIERIFITWKNLFFGAVAGIFYFRGISLITKILIAFLIMFSPYLVYLISYVLKNKNFLSYLKNYKNIIPQIIFKQVVFTFISLFQYYIILNNFLKINFISVFKSVPLVHLSHILPISFSGFGIREFFAMEIFAKLGIKAEVAVCTTLFIFLINTVIPALIGEYFLLKEKVRL